MCLLVLNVYGFSGLWSQSCKALNILSFWQYSMELFATT